MPSFRYSALAAVVAAFIVAGLVVRIAHALVHRVLDALEIVGTENRAAVHARAKQLIRALTVLAFGLAAIASVSLALSRLGIGESQWNLRSEEHTSELQSRVDLVCRLLLEIKKR